MLRCGFRSFISECGFGGIRRRAPIKRFVCAIFAFFWSFVMIDQASEWPPEQYRLAPNDYLAALGQLTFVYNMLESMMRNIFIKYLPFAEDYARMLFHKLNNRDRIDLLSAFVKENEKDNDVSEAILYCINCFDICTENRNILMH